MSISKTALDILASEDNSLYRCGKLEASRNHPSCHFSVVIILLPQTVNGRKLRLINGAAEAKALDQQPHSAVLYCKSNQTSFGQQIDTVQSRVWKHALACCPT